ncbi:class I SAM-dependent methyltransferase [Desulfofarcimen acetoxidans]|uniref:class I SAM-dependent methyltransferase n=1 Tax=Desulfofarcimen acetoxidans TaxID=58138 RepID=UPI0024163291|nr:class I SAM-dependent methyltransferase [Desulfofarcimen acetoxidans]
MYDNQHQKFRDYEKEFIDFLSNLSLDNYHNVTMIDLGCGTGATSLYASKYFKKIYAIDVSELMIKQVIKKSEKENITNIEFINSGFLSYEHKAEPVDIVLTKSALHHLPDFWKQVALLRINKMLKPSGIFYLFDVIYHFQPTEYINKIDNFISAFEAMAGEQFKAEVETHIRDEFSTFSWIMEGMLARAGFEVEKIRTSDGFVMEYYCKKVRDIALP